MKIVWGVVALVLIGGVAYVLSQQVLAPEPQGAGETLTDAQKQEILDGITNKDAILSDKEKLKLLESIKTQP